VLWREVKDLSVTRKETMMDKALMRKLGGAFVKGAISGGLLGVAEFGITKMVDKIDSTNATDTDNQTIPAENVKVEPTETEQN
jgi:hypothetical protein